MQCNTLQSLSQRQDKMSTTLQHTATHCNTPQTLSPTWLNHVTYCKWVMSHMWQESWGNRKTENVNQTAAHCNTLQHTATCCNTHQILPHMWMSHVIHVTERSKPKNVSITLQHTATHCNTLQHTATPYNTLQHPDRHTYKKLSSKDPVLRPGLGHIVVQYKIDWYWVLQEIPVSNSIDTAINML